MHANTNIHHDMCVGRILIEAVVEILPAVGSRIQFIDASIDEWVPPPCVPRAQKAFALCNCHSFRLQLNLLCSTMQLVTANYPPLDILSTARMSDQGVGGNTLSVAMRRGRRQARRCTCTTLDRRRASRNSRGNPERMCVCSVFDNDVMYGRLWDICPDNAATER